MKQKITSFLSTINNDIFNISNYLYKNPEPSFQEHKACEYLIHILNSHGFKVKNNFLDISTAFYAQYGNGHPKICYICEYDAFENKGHLTGHNLVSSMSIGAALSLSKVINDLHGSVIVVGCPGEFVGSSKITMAKQGVFDDIDVVLMAHPDVITAESGSSYALIPLQIDYLSKGGIAYKETCNCSALDACTLTLNAINTLSKKFTNECSINTIISNGGVSPYLLPSNCRCKLYIRSHTTDLALSLNSKIRNLVKCIGDLFDIQSNTHIYETPYQELITNYTLSRMFSHNLKESGIINIGEPIDTNSGLSLGTISHKVPCIHPYISIIDNNHKSVKYFSQEFSNATISSFAHDKVIKTCTALAFTALDLIQKESLLNEIQTEFNKVKKD